MAAVCTTADQDGGEDLGGREQDRSALAPCIPGPSKGGFLRCYGVPLTGGVACVHNKDLGVLAEPLSPSPLCVACRIGGGKDRGKRQES